MADDTVEAARRTLLIEIDTCLERAFAQQGKGSGYIVERLDALIAAVRAEKIATERCPDCSFDPTNLNDYCAKHRPRVG